MSDRRKLAYQVLNVCRGRGIALTTAESCTGGMVASALTDIAGSSDVFDRGFVTYSNEAKMEMLGVPFETIRDHGAVSEQTALAMANGALVNSNAHLTLSVTGIAGPGGGSDDKPVGTVWFGLATEFSSKAVLKSFGDQDRATIRFASVDTALELLLGQVP